MPLRQHDVFRLDVAVDDPQPVRMDQRIEHVPKYPRRFSWGELAHASEAGPKSLPLGVGHYVKEGAGPARERRGNLTGIDERQDVGMLEMGGDADFTEEPFGAQRCGELRAYHLDRDCAVVLEVVGKPDYGHATAAELPLEAVAIGQGGL